MPEHIPLRAQGGSTRSPCQTPSVCFVVPCRPDQRPRSVRHLLGSDTDGIQVLVAGGCHPSAQRNAVLGSVRAPIVYFLDDDSIIEPGALRQALAVFDEHPEVAVVGGPSLPPDPASRWQRLMGWLFAHPLGTLAYRLRYSTDGPSGPADDRSLILANLAFRTEVLRKSGGFDERLYPNEENELLGRLQAQGHVLWRDPLVAVRRPHRRNVFELAKQMWRYGRGRGYQTRIHPAGAGVFRAAVPALLGIGNVIVPALLAMSGGLRVVLDVPYLVYVSVLLGGAAAAAVRSCSPLALALAPLFWLCHTVYGSGVAVGLLAGIGGKPRGSRDRVVVEEVASGLNEGPRAFGPPRRRSASGSGAGSR